VRVLLEAARILAANPGVPAHTVRVIGTGDETYTDSLQGYVAEHGLTNVSFEGHGSAADVQAALRSARCSVTPSLWYDNMPNSALESMAESTPVVAPRHGCFPELIRDGETGVLYEPADAASLADALSALLLDPVRASQLGARAREFVVERHSPDLHYATLMETFERALISRTAA
jgi:glycosyltransferase involved in cell wall biosynthesis